MDEQGRLGGERPSSFERFPDGWNGWTWTDTTARRWTWKADPPPVPAKYRVPMALHHVMPWETIRQAWNVFIVNRAWDVLLTWAQLLHVESAVHGLKAEIDQNGKVRFDANWSAYTKGQIPESADELHMTKDDFLRRLCWSAWNLVEGPRLRADDPRNQLDVFDPQEMSRIFTIREIHYDFRTAISAGQTAPLSKQQLTATERLLKNARPVLRNAQVVSFKESWWRVAQAGKYTSDGQAQREPTWRKAYGSAS